MKTNTCKAKVMILSFLALCLGVVSCYDDTAIWDRFEAMETTRIATIDQQIDAIKASITDLKNVDTTIKGLIANLEAEAANLQVQIEENAATDEATKKALEDEIANINALITALQAKDAEIVEKIAELQTYVDSEIAAVKDWTSTTFSTLEQYQATCNEIAAIKVLIAEQEASLTKALTDAIAASETSMKGWVNEQLTGYWTIAETQAKLDTIKTNTDKEVEAVKADLKTATEELTAAYKSEIAKAITDSEGKLSAKIDEINATLNKRIGAIEARLDAIEEKLNNLTREFAIKFDDSEIGIMPGGTTTVGYTITGATEKTIVKAFGQNGWSAKVSMESNTTGSITVKAPNPITEEEIIVLVYDGEYRTIMSTINFVKGFATPSQAAIEFETEADTVTIELTSNIDCKISIPTNAQSWLSVVEPSTTRAVTTKSISFACTECTGGIRKATVSFVDEAGVVVSTMSFVQQGSTIEVTLTEAGTLMEAIGQDVIQDIKGLIINGPINGTDISCIRGMSNLVYLNMENARIVEGGNPYYIENRDFYTVENVIGEFMFRGAQSLHEVSCEVILPANIIRIEDFAFDYCGGLSSVQMPSTVQSIGEYVFWQCGKITEITLPADLRTIGAAAFAGCQLDEIIFPERLNSIGRAAFNDNRIKTLTIPSQIRSIGESAFSGNPLTEIHLLVSPAKLKNIGNDLFDSSVYDDAVLYIPKGTLEDYTKTDFGRFTNIVEKYDNVILDVRDTVWVEGESIFLHRSDSLLPGQKGPMGKGPWPVLEGAYETNIGNYENLIEFNSPLYRFRETLKGVRFIVHAVGDPTEVDKNGNPHICISGFAMFDEYDNPIPLTIENVVSNATEKEGQGIPGMLDYNPRTFFHSLWRTGTSEPHYIEVTLPEGKYSAFSFKMLSFEDSRSRVFPAEMEITSVDPLATSLIAELQQALTAARKLNLSFGTGVGFVNIDPTTFNAALAEGDAIVEKNGGSPSEVRAAINKIHDIIEHADIMMPETGRKYRIISGEPRFFSNQNIMKALTLHTDNIYGDWLWWETATAEGAAQQEFILEPCKNESGRAYYTFKNAATGLYLGELHDEQENLVPNRFVFTERRDSFWLKSLGQGQFGIMASDDNSRKQLNMEFHNNGEWSDIEANYGAIMGVKSYIHTWNSEANQSSAWFFREMVELPQAAKSISELNFRSEAISIYEGVNNLTITADKECAFTDLAILDVFGNNVIIDQVTVANRIATLVLSENVETFMVVFTNDEGVDEITINTP